jgi:hypothetical protein
VSVQVSVAGSGLGEDEGLRAAPFRLWKVLLETRGQIEVNGLWGCCPLADSRDRLKETGK